MDPLHTLTPALPQSEQGTAARFPLKHGPREWVKTLWPLGLHCVFAVNIAVVMAYSVNNRHFHPTERRPSVNLTDGTTIHSREYGLLQSDVTTVLSLSLVTLRLVLGLWTASLCWRIAVLLMEKTGLQRGDLALFVGSGFFTPVAYFSNPEILFMGALVMTTLFASAISPLLTGSITWTPSSDLLESQQTIDVPIINNTDLWGTYSNTASRREYTTIQAADYVATAWGRDIEGGVLKRVLPSTAGMTINSVIASVTLPHFSITSLEWIANPGQSLNESQRNIAQVAPRLVMQGTENPLLASPGTAALIPDVAWSARPFPQPSMVSETRILVLYTSSQSPQLACGPNNSSISSNLPPNMGFHQEEGGNCFAFARVTFKAGVVVCAKCRISSGWTVQNDNTFELEADVMAAEALWLMPEIISTLVLTNSSIPSSWGNIDEYVANLLGRSYSGAWTALTAYLGQSSPPLTPGYSVPVPTLQARLDRPRVILWLCSQLLATLCGVIFLWRQAKTEYRLVGDTTLAAFDLDTSEIARRTPSANDVLKLERRGGVVKVIIHEPQRVSMYSNKA